MVRPRIIVFFVIALLYVILCPLILLYGFGYIYSFHSTQGILKTGLVSLASVPSKATVYVAGSRFLQQTPVVIRDLTPGDYMVRVTKRNYRPWEELIQVNAGMASAREHIILIPQQFNPVVRFPESFSRMVPVEGTRFLILQQGRRCRDYAVCDVRKFARWPLIPESLPWQDAVIERIMTRADSPWIVLWCSSQGKQLALHINLLDRENAVTDISDYFTAQPTEVQWDTRDEANLFVSYGKVIWRVELDKRVVSPFADDVKGFAVHDRLVYVVTGTNKLLRMDFDRKKIELLHDDGASLVQLFSPLRSCRIDPVARNLLLFRGPRGELSATIPPYRLLNEGIVGTAVDREHAMALVYTKSSLAVIDPGKEQDAAGKSLDDARLTWVTEGAHAISRCQWIYRGTHVLYGDRDALYLRSISADQNSPMVLRQGAPGKIGLPSAPPADGLAHPAVSDRQVRSDGTHTSLSAAEYLFEIKSPDDFYYVEETGMIVYLSRHESRLESVTLLPPEELFGLMTP